MGDRKPMYSFKSTISHPPFPTCPLHLQDLQFSPNLVHLVPPSKSVILRQPLGDGRQIPRIEPFDGGNAVEEWLFHINTVWLGYCLIGLFDLNAAHPVYPIF